MAVDLSRSFLPEALAKLSRVKGLGGDDRLRMNQIGGAGYLRIFDVLETCLADAVRGHASRDVDARDALVPLLRLDALDHNELFRAFDRAFRESFPVAAAPLDRPKELDEVLASAGPLSLLVFALHLKLVTQQHWLACVRGDEALAPMFVKVLKEHWTEECGAASACPARAIELALAAALPGRVPAALRDYRRILFATGDLLARQGGRDVATLEAARGAPLAPAERAALVDAAISAYRNTFLTIGIVNTSFVYAMRSLGPEAPSMLAGVVTALAEH